ncbi:MAG: LTA synthase family protein [Propionibacteriaceae bacterium]|nr:LTA synthase family protein [Propionibacteriaceae bacterium]
MPKRAFWVLLTAVACVGFTPAPANAAYIDPATTSYLIQIVSGLVITLSVAIGVFFRKLQLFFLTLGAKTSAFWVRTFTASGRRAWKAQKKRRLAVEDAAGTQAAPTTTTWSKRAFLWHDDRRWWARLGLSAAMSFSLAMVFVLFSVLDLFSSNATQFAFTIHDLLPVTLLIFACLGAGLTVALFIFRGRVFDALICAVAGVSTAGWLQMHFWNPDFGSFMGVPVKWQDYTRVAVVNLAMWFAVIAAVFLIRVLSKKLWTAVMVVLAIVILAGSSVSLIGTYSASSTQVATTQQNVGYLSYNNAFSLSSTRNAVIFVVDEFDGNIPDRIRQDDPHFFDPLTGFTQFTQNMSRFSQTDPGVPSMLTGQDYFFTTTYSAYKSQAWADATALRTLKDAGYSVNVYSGQFNSYAHDSDIAGLVDNFATAPTVVDRKVMAKGMLQLASFVDAPVIAKPSFWMDTTEFAHVTTTPADAPAPYGFDDFTFSTKLDQHGLTLRGDQPQVNFFHLQGSHAPWTLGEDGRPVAGGTNDLVQTKGVFHIIYDYLDEMKRLGIYDDATIIITADHGRQVSAEIRELDHPLLASLFVKPRGSSTEPLAFSAAPTSQLNLWPTVLKDAGPMPHTTNQAYDAVTTPRADTVSYFDVPEDSLAPRTYVWYRPMWNSDPGFGDRFEVVGDARDFANWHLVEKFPLLFGNLSE